MSVLRQEQIRILEGDTFTFGDKSDAGPRAWGVLGAALIRPGWVPPSGVPGALRDLPGNCCVQALISCRIMTFLCLTADAGFVVMKAGPWRGGQKDPGGPPNWFICQVIRGTEGAVIGHGLWGRLRGRAPWDGPGGRPPPKWRLPRPRKEKPRDLPLGSWSETESSCGLFLKTALRREGVACHCSFASPPSAFLLRAGTASRKDVSALGSDEGWRLTAVRGTASGSLPTAGPAGPGLAVSASVPWAVLPETLGGASVSAKPRLLHP